MLRTMLIASALIAVTPAIAQNRPSPADDDPQAVQQPRFEPAPSEPTPAGRIATSPVGEVGQRQTREQVPNVQPMARIASRINNRVQNRISSRIDRSYNPQVDAASSVGAAEEQARTASRTR